MADIIVNNDYIIKFTNSDDISVYSNVTKKYLKKIDKLGYYGFNVNRKFVFVHHIITEYYLGKRQNNLCVNHKDGNKKNNNIDNLEYITLSENTKHSYRTGLHAIAKDVKNSPKYIDGRCKDLKKYQADWYKANREKCITRAKLNYLKHKA